MGFLVSPGVHVKEIDLTNVVPAVATTVGAISCAFERGPTGEVVTVGSEEELLKKFGKPITGSLDNTEEWFTAANFLQYSDQLKVVRAGGDSVLKNACVSGTAIIIRNDTHYQESFAGGAASVGEFAARTPGTWGNSIGVSMCGTAAAYEEKLGAGKLLDGTPAAGATSITVDGGTDFVIGDLISFYTASNYLTESAGHEGKEYEVTAISSNDLTIRQKDDVNGTGLAAALSDDQYIKRRWKFYDLFNSAPGTSQWSTDNGRASGDEVYVVVYDATGDITGYDNDVAGQRTSSVLELFEGSKNPKSKTAQGSTNYLPDVIFQQSEYIYWMDWPATAVNAGATAWGTDVAASGTYDVTGGSAGTGPHFSDGRGDSITKPFRVTFGTVAGSAVGVDDTAISAGDLMNGYGHF